MKQGKDDGPLISGDPAADRALRELAQVLDEISRSQAGRRTEHRDRAEDIAKEGEMGPCRRHRREHEQRMEQSAQEWLESGQWALTDPYVEDIEMMNGDTSSMARSDDEIGSRPPGSLEPREGEGNG